MHTKQKIYAAVLGVLSLGVLAAWTVQAVMLSNGTYADPLLDGWLLVVYMLISPFATGFAVALKRPDKAVIAGFRMLVICQIPLFALLLCAGNVTGVETVMKAMAAIWTILTAVSGVIVAISVWQENPN